MAKVVRKPGPGAKKLQAILDGMGNANARVGFLETAQYPDGTPVAYVAVIHENGVEENNLPPRPFFAPTVARCATEWQELARKLAQRIAGGKMTIKGGLTILAAQAAKDVQQSIRDVVSPGLKRVTIAQRMRKQKQHEAEEGGTAKIIKSTTKPLMETEYMLDSVQFDVSDGKGDSE